MVEVKEGDAEEPGEAAQFLPLSADSKYIHVKAANAQYSVVVAEDKANCDDGSYITQCHAVINPTTAVSCLMPHWSFGIHIKIHSIIPLCFVD